MQAPVLLTVIFFSAVAVFPQNPSRVHRSVAAEGEYIGLQKMGNLSPEEADTKWFHENTLVTRDDDAILGMVPIYTRHGHKVYSASDGGFLTYRGRFFRRDGRGFISLRLFQADYILTPAGKDIYNEVKTYPVTIADRAIEFDGVRYRPNTLDKAKTTRLLQQLRTEPLKKPAK